MRSLTERARQTEWGRRACAVLALGLMVGALSACDTLLDVDLPAELTDQALEDPTGAETQMVTAVTHFEDAFDFSIDEIAGREDVGEIFMCGPSCSHYQYQITHGEFAGFSKARRFASGLHTKLIDDWTVNQVPDRAELLAISSIYEGAALQWMGDALCEFSVDGGSVMTPDQGRGMAETLYTTALAEIAAAGDFAMPSRIASSATTMTYGLRAQTRWAKGDMAGAVADAQQVPNGFVAVVTREMNRRNYIGSNRNIGGFLDMYDPIDWWPGGNNPVTGAAWPATIPFTGYTFLGINPDGRAVSDAGIPVRTAGTTDLQEGNDIGVSATAVADTRVPHRAVEIQGKGGKGYVPTKYAAEDDDVPLVNWKEMVLIRAEGAGGQGAIDLVNELRTEAGLPLVTYADPTNATQIKYMIIEERRRALMLEGRYFQTKLKNPGLLWFPRGIGGTRGFDHGFRGGVRFLMPEGEFVNNTNLTTADRATGCSANEKPVNIDG